MKKITSDYWKAYTAIVPRKKHIQAKAERVLSLAKKTFTVEGYNSLFRHFLARIKKRSKCYSKCIKMLELSVFLLMHKRNKTLSILN